MSAVSPNGDNARLSPSGYTCVHCGRSLIWRGGCWQDDDGYACPAIPVGNDRHVPAE